MASINDAIESNNFEELSRLTHTLKGSSGNLRITSIYELSIKLEKSAVKQDADECVRFFIKLKNLAH